jgi:hypothetical protein
MNFAPYDKQNGGSCVKIWKWRLGVEALLVAGL